LDPRVLLDLDPAIESFGEAGLLVVICILKANLIIVSSRKYFTV
jgi:hypothetical protein